MTFVRLFAALLFAVVLLVVGYGIFWFVAFRFAEQNMTATLQSHLDMTVSYDVPKWQPNLGKVSVKLPQVLARTDMPSGEVMVLNLPEVTLESGFFDDGRELKLYLPQTMYATILRDEKKVAEYRISMSGGEALLLRNMMIFANQAARIEEGDKLLMGWANGQISWEPLPDGAAKVLVQAQSVQGVAGEADALSFRGTVLGMREMKKPTWALVRLANEDALAAWLQNGVKTLAKGGELVVDGLTVKKGPLNLAFSGNLAVGRDGVPYGDLVVQAGDGDTVARVLEESGIIRPVRMEERIRYDQAMVKFAQGQTSGKLVLHQGVAILNTLRVGQVPSASAVVRQWI